MDSKTLRKVKLKNGFGAEICVVCKNDAGQLLECFKSVAAEENFILSTLPDIAKLVPDLEKEAEWIQNTFDSGGLILAAKIDGKFAGYISVLTELMARRKHIATIGICLLKQYRNFGLGKALLESVIEWAKRNPAIEKLTLDVFENNNAAINLYKKLGFIEEGRKVKDIKLGPNNYVDSVIMCKFVK